MSNELRKFLQAWLDWALASEVTVAVSEHFSPTGGLCACLINYTNGKGTLIYELEELFMNGNLYCAYPFGREDYLKRLNEKTQHLCPQRLDWVKARLHEYPN